MKPVAAVGRPIGRQLLLPAQHWTGCRLERPIGRERTAAAVGGRSG